MAITINLSNLSTYVNQLSPELGREAVLTGRFISQIDTQEGIKNAETINAMTSTLTVGLATCGLITASMSAVPFQNTIQVTELMVGETLCSAEFNTKYLGMFQKSGSYQEDAPDLFHKAYIADKMDKIGANNEDTLIQSSPNGTFSSITVLTGGGLLYQCSTGTTGAQVIAAGITNSYSITTAVGIVDQMIAKIPSDLYNQEDMTLFMSYADYRTYITNLRNNNWYHVSADESANGLKFETYHPGSGILVSATRGFNGITGAAFGHYFILTPKSNLVKGCDLAHDFENFQFFYSPEYDTTTFRSKYKLGIAARFYQYIVLGKCN